MKKKVLAVILTVCLIVVATLWTVTAVSASSSVKSGDYYYVVLSDGTAEITSYVGTETGTLTIPSTIDSYTVTSIGEKAFWASNSVFSSVVIPDTVTSIGYMAFSDRTNLTSVTIGSGVKTIGERAFGYTGLTSIVIPGNVQTIGSYAFTYCKSLNSVTISNGVETIGVGAFYSNTELISITIPASVESIGFRAFGYCSTLASVTINGCGTSIDSNAFESTPALTNNNISQASHTPSGSGTVTQEATCIEEGVMTYTCSVCNNTYTEAIAAKGHSWGDTVYTWSQDGKSCTATRTCENDNTHVEEATATVTDVKTKEATCTEKGETTYTAVFSESWASSQTKVVEDIPANSHSLEHVLAVDATCTTAGNIEYWYCSDCKGYFSDADCTQAITQAETITSALGHTLQHFEAVEAGCDTVGNVEYWYCGDCDTYFSDANAAAEITLSQTVVAATGEHEYEVSAIVWNYEDGTATVKCLECGEYHTFDATVTSKNVLGQTTYTITTTINGIEYTDTKTTGTSLMMVQASYSAVTAAIEKANSLNPDDYEDFTPVTDAINAVDWSLSVLNQNQVNSYAEAIEEAINNLVLAETVNITEETIEVIDPVEAGETDME